MDKTLAIQIGAGVPWATLWYGVLWLIKVERSSATLAISLGLLAFQLFMLYLVIRDRD